MSHTALLLVLVAGMVHAAWNIAAKKANGDVRFAFFIGASTVVVWAPVGLVLGWMHLPQWSTAAWLCVVASGVIHVAYFVVLLRGYRKADLTVVYPVARGSAPMLSASAALLLFGEQLSAIGLVGIAAIVVGVFFISGGHAMLRTAKSPEQIARLRNGLLYGGLTGFTIASYTVVDAYAVKALLLSPMLVYYLSCVVHAAVLLPVAWSDKAKTLQHWRLQWRYAVTVGVLSPVSYVLVLYAMQLAPVSHVAPAREVSLLFAALIGGHLLGEGDRWMRVGGALCIGLGVVALGLG